MLVENTKKRKLYAPISGNATGLSKVNDSMFNSGMMGDGVAIIPKTKTIVAPCDGVVELIADTKHYIVIKTNDGLGILIHLGLDTVEMNGNGFECFVEQGQEVNIGDKIIDMDLDKIKDMDLDNVVLIVMFPQREKFSITGISEGECVAGKTEIWQYKNIGS